MMTILTSVVVVAQSLEQGPQSYFLTRLVGKVVAVVVELCVLWSRCAVRTYLFQDTFWISALYQPLCHALRTKCCELCSGAFDTVVRVTATTNSSAAVHWVSTS